MLARWRWALLLTLLLPTTVGAVQSVTLGAYPTGALASPTPWFRFSLAPGQSTTDSITVDNRSNTPQDVLLYGVDAAPNGDGGFGMMPQSARPIDVGNWIRLSTPRVHLNAQTQQTVPFRLTIPTHPSVGPHYGGIIVQPAPPSAAVLGDVGIHVVSRLGVRLYLTVPGHSRPKLELTSFRKLPNYPKLTLATSLHNSGNTLLAPSGELRLSSPLQPTIRVRFNAGRSLAPSQQIQVLLPSSLPTGGLPRRYTARLELQYGHPYAYLLDR
jgi:hypothetical protein